MRWKFRPWWNILIPKPWPSPSSILCLSTNWISMHTFYLSYLHYELRNFYLWVIHDCIKFLFKYMTFHIYFQINKIPSLFLSLKVKNNIGNRWASKFSATNRILVIENGVFRLKSRVTAHSFIFSFLSSIRVFFCKKNYSL